MPFLPCFQRFWRLVEKSMQKCRQFRRFGMLEMRGRLERFSKLVERTMDGKM